VIAAACVAAAGCGADRKPEAPSKSAFIAKASRACRAANSEAATLRKPRGPREAQLHLTHALSIERNLVDRLRQLRPPDDLRAE
jgi:hypothetical protein